MSSFGPVAPSWKRGRGPVTGYRGAQRLEPESNDAVRTRISDITPHQPNSLLVGIVVAKQSVRSFPDKKNPGSKRFNFTFTMRDSPTDYINVTCWGTEPYIQMTFESFRMCDVVQLLNSQVVSKIGGDSENKWKPWTPSQYQVNASEQHSTISLHKGCDYTEFTGLAHLPLRPIADCCPLGHIIASGQAVDHSSVNILAVIKHPGTPKQMTSRNGKPLRKCEVLIMDETCAKFILNIWDNELIELAQTWIPKENIIFAVDVRVSYDSFRSTMVGTCNQRTIIMTNPDCKEAHQLYQFAQSLSAEVFAVDDGKHEMGDFDSGTDVQSITQLYSVEELLREQRDGQHSMTSFTGILFVFLTSLDIAHTGNTVVCYSTSCKFKVDENATLCQNKTCSSLSTGVFTCEPHYNLLISLSDCTGGVEGVRLAGQAAANMIQHPPLQFLSLTESEKMMLKSTFLLERFKVYFKSGMFLPDQKKPVVRVLHMSLADPLELETYFKG